MEVLYPSPILFRPLFVSNVSVARAEIIKQRGKNSAELKIRIQTTLKKRNRRRKLAEDGRWSRDSRR